MKLQITRGVARQMVAAFPDLTSLAEQLRFDSQIEVRSRELPRPVLAWLAEHYAEGGPSLAGMAAQVSTLHDALNDASMDGPGTQVLKADDLESLVPLLARYLGVGTERGWLFQANAAGKPLAWVPTRIDYTAASNEETGKVFLELKANAKGSLATQTLRFTASDIDGARLPEMLAAKGFLRETPALRAAYDQSLERFFAWRGQYGAQFTAQGVGFFAEDPGASHRNTDWTRKDVVVLSTSGQAARLVNDESILTQRSTVLDAPGDVLAPYLGKAGKSNQYDFEDEVRALREELAQSAPGLFKQMPVHGYVLMFHLELHHYVWVHVDDLTPYVYQPDLKHKLILPPEQTDLIDILTAEMDVLMDDIVAGKSGGTTVLCAGPPGVGKTLTAEVYAEIVRRPLYRVHSGQLGLNVASMEAALKDVLTRAQRWGAVMLIDEADVYIKKRADDLTMNAVVGVFLRVLEYFNGLLFLTTNRVDDIDEAIVSRCIALIRFHAPDETDRSRIWGVMAEQFGLDLDAATCASLARVFPLASGRDIKGLAKLVAKYCHHKQTAPTLEVFERCAIFRGMSGDDIAWPLAA